MRRPFCKTRLVVLHFKALRRKKEMNTYNIDPASEPLRILLARGVFTDEQRGGRGVPFKIYHPAEPTGEKHPMIIWSHGLGGSRDGAGTLARFLASHGYIVVNIQHHGTDTSLWEGKPGHPWDVIKQSVISHQTKLDRFRDVPFVLDSLKIWAQENPEIGVMFDFERIGMSGHSFGALTTQVMAGQLFPDENGDLISMIEPRFKAGILYSPVPISNMTQASNEEIYSSMAIPLFHMTGTLDDSPLESFGTAERSQLFEYGTAPAYFLSLQDGDHMVFVGSRGKLGENPKQKEHEEIIKVAALAFWDAHLRAMPQALEWLQYGGFAHYLPEGEFEVRLS
jgi:dienelactone hydrolase